jgi:hypothetical protein
MEKALGFDPEETCISHTWLSGVPCVASYVALLVVKPDIIATNPITANTPIIISLMFFMINIFRLKYKITKTYFENSFVHCIDKLDIMKKLILLFLALISCGDDDDKGVIPPEPIKEPNAIVVCYEIYLPVCGSDGITYSNDCKARVAGITEFTTGECSN